jgi:hypothetical protein
MSSTAATGRGRFGVGTSIDPFDAKNRVYVEG